MKVVEHLSGEIITYAGCIRKVKRGGVGEFLLCKYSLTSPQRPPSWGEKKVAVVERWL